MYVGEEDLPAGAGGCPLGEDNIRLREAAMNLFSSTFVMTVTTPGEALQSVWVQQGPVNSVWRQSTRLIQSRFDHASTGLFHSHSRVDDTRFFRLD